MDVPLELCEVLRRQRSSFLGNQIRIEAFVLSLFIELPLFSRNEIGDGLNASRVALRKHDAQLEVAGAYIHKSGQCSNID